VDLNAVFAVLPAHGLGLAGQHHPCPVDQDNVRAQILHRFHAVRRNEQGGARRPPLQQDVLQQPGVDRIKARKGFIQNQQVRIVHQCSHQLNFLLHAFGKLLGFFVPPGLHFQAGHPMLGRLQCLTRFQTPQPGQVKQLLPDFHFFVEPAFFGQVTNSTGMFRPQFAAVQPNAPAVRGCNPVNHSNEGRFAGSVGTQQAHDSALGDLHADIEKGSVVSVAFADGTYVQKGHNL